MQPVSMFIVWQAAQFYLLTFYVQGNCTRESRRETQVCDGGGGGVSQFRDRGGILGDRVAQPGISDCFYIRSVYGRICSRLLFLTWARNPLSTLL